MCLYNPQARCPILTVLEVQQHRYSVADCCTIRDLPDDDSDESSSQPAVPAVDAAAGDAAAGAEGGAEGGAPLTLSQKKKELWDAKEARLRATSERAGTPGWCLASLIIKSNDDLRQEVFIMQLIRLFVKIFPPELTWLRPYHIQAPLATPTQSPHHPLATPMPPRGCTLGSRRLHIAAIRPRVGRTSHRQTLPCATARRPPAPTRA